MSHTHGGGCCPGAGSRIVQLGQRQPGIKILAARPQNATVGQQRGCVIAAVCDDAARRGPCATGRVIYFRGGQTLAAADVFSSDVCRPRPLSVPPATRTLPSASSVAVWPKRPVIKLPVPVQVPLVGSYTSAEAKARGVASGPLSPPTTSTLPSSSSVAV